MIAIDKRVAILVPSAPYGAYWPPILEELNEKFQELKFFTGRVWPGFDPELPGAGLIELVGKSKSITLRKNDQGYSKDFILASPTIILNLLRYKPHVLFVSGFSLWTLLSILFRNIGKWKIIIAYEGSSPNVDHKDSNIRLFFRRFMVRSADLLVSNSSAGAAYLVDTLNASSNKIYTNPYMVPDANALLKKEQDVSENVLAERGIRTFLFVGQVVTRKGISSLLKACLLLKQSGRNKFKLVIVGDGIERQELELFANQSGLQEHVSWIGWVAYSYLGKYFRESDVFVFPSYEDTWGMVVLEAMAFGKPVLCSKWAGARELVLEGQNGFLFNPHAVEELASAMAKLIDNPMLVKDMGDQSKNVISKHTPQHAADFLSGVASKVSA